MGKASTRVIFIDKAVQHVAGDSGNVLIDQQCGYPGDRSHGKNSASFSGLVVDNFGAAVIWIQALCQQHGIRRGRRTALVRLMTGGAAWNPFVQSLLPEQISVSETGIVEDPV